MADVWFYHLEGKSAEQELPGLLVRGLERELQMVVFVQDAAQARTFSDRLWASADVDFIPHGLGTDDDAKYQPILICVNDAPANGAKFAFYVNGAEPGNVAAFERASVMFDGRDESAVQQARILWKRVKAEGHAIKYWKQDETGRWVNQAT